MQGYTTQKNNASAATAGNNISKSSISYLLNFLFRFFCIYFNTAFILETR
jgi:hypothetical protein